jgi:ubiquinone/menaquinone biosynthesis C-methylase UbiE
MERLENEHFDNDKLLQAEHHHRYLWASKYAQGNICDLACGYGYGAEVLSKNQKITNYVGIDASAEAIEQANKRFSSDGRRYILASATDIPLGDQSVDTVISLETLEHLKDPLSAILEFKRILTPNGLLVGSVPSRYFDDLAESVYGENPHHVTRFEYRVLARLLSDNFSNVRIYYSALEVVTHIGSLMNECASPQEQATLFRDHENDPIAGSFHFVATDSNALNLDSMHKNQIHFCTGLTDLDAARVMPLRKLVALNEHLVGERDKYIRELTSLITQKDEHILKIETRLRDLGQVALFIPQPILRLAKHLTKLIRRQ